MSRKPRIALVSTPWPLFNRPSIQMGALKAYAKEKLPELEVASHHLYLSVAETLGYDLYKEISERTWLSECCYAALLYAEKREAVSRLWRAQSKGTSLCRKEDFQEICTRLEAASSRIVDGTPWARYGLAGFSICFGQLLSALYFIQRIKERAPRLKVVVGGSACGGDMGISLLRAFPDIDFAVSGEGEIPFVHLLSALTGSGGAQSLRPISGLLFRKGDSIVGTNAFSQVHSLEDLPIPDFDDYFLHLKRLPPEKRFLPRLPMEMSRGCWWRRPHPGPARRGCAFCNLNLQWDGYRTKSSKRILSEMEALAEKHQTLSISYTDNLLPPRDLQRIFHGIARLGKDFRLFGEIRATTGQEVLAAMAAAGTAEVQVGIEALSTSLLKKLCKGTTAIENLQIMKNCEARGTPTLTGNLILRFPGSDGTDVEETLRNLEFCLPFRPLMAVPFWLGRESPVWHTPERYGIRKVFNHPFYTSLFPSEILNRLELLIQGYLGDAKRQRKLWQPVSRAVKRWKNGYSRLRQDGTGEPLLSYADGRDFLIIRQRRIKEAVMTHRLQGTSREIYLFCERHRSVSEILARFPRVGEQKLLPFLRMMVEKRLVFREGDRYLSLAVPIRGYAR